MENLLYKKQIPEVLYFERTLQDYFDFCQSLKKLCPSFSSQLNPVFLCIGTDRMTGDCLGPLVGHKLERHSLESGRIFGTLEHPVHALNLNQTLIKIQNCFTDPFLIVIDAALGLSSHIGCVTLSSGSLLPGEGMKKNLPAVGDLSITGIVNSCHGNASQLLQNTRLHLVNELADFIFTGLISSFSF